VTTASGVVGVRPDVVTWQRAARAVAAIPTAAFRGEAAFALLVTTMTVVAARLGVTLRAAVS
jgi:hypothetical protein